MRSSFSRSLLPMALILATCAGCGALSKCCSHLRAHCDAKSVLSPSAALPTVDVGGMVTHPGRIEIPPTGMTLRRALTLAGSVPPQVGAMEGVFIPAETLQRYRDKAEEVGRLTTIHTHLPPDTTQEQQEAAETNTRNATRELDDMEERIFVTGDEKTELKNLRGSAIKHGLFKELAKLPGQDMQFINEGIKRHGDDATVWINALSAKLTASSVSTVTGAMMPMVALQRESSISTHYFPYDLCATGLAGEIRLEPDDLVQVVDVRRTSLNATANVDPRNIAITGFVRKPGTLRQQDSRVTMIKDVMDVSQPEFVGPDGAVVIVRDAANGIGEDVFVLPTNLLSAKPLALSPRRGGDIYHFTPLAQVPAIFDGLVQSVVQTATPTPFAPDEDMSAEHCREKICKLNSCPATQRFLRECRSLKATLETRLPVPSTP